MPKLKLTAQAIESIKTPVSGRVEYWDELAPGMALRVTSKGTKSWMVMYRLHGKQFRYTVGEYPAYSLADARMKAREVLNRVGRGENPSAEKKKQKRQARIDIHLVPETVEQAVHDFIEKYAKKHTRNWKETERVLIRHLLKSHGDHSLKSITKRDVLVELDKLLEEKKSYMANRVLATVRKFLNWCVEREKIESNPIATMKAPGQESARDRILNNEEIKAIWGACLQMGYPFGDAYRMLLLTGQRRDEVATMRWVDIDLDNALWTLPRESTKSDRLHEVPLPPLAMKILHKAKRIGEYVFATLPDRPISGFGKTKADCDKKSGITGWRLHDLRRTAASGMARLNISPHVVEKVLNHASGTIRGVAAIYNRHGYLEEKRHALNMWGREIGQLVGSDAKKKSER